MKISLRHFQFSASPRLTYSTHQPSNTVYSNLMYNTVQHVPRMPTHRFASLLVKSRAQEQSRRKTKSGGLGYLPPSVQYRTIPYRRVTSRPPNLIYPFSISISTCISISHRKKSQAKTRQDKTHPYPHQLAGFVSCCSLCPEKGIGRIMVLGKWSDEWNESPEKLFLKENFSPGCSSLPPGPLNHAFSAPFTVLC